MKHCPSQSRFVRLLTPRTRKRSFTATSSRRISFDVPRYMFTKLTRCKMARRQEQLWLDNIRRRFRWQTVRTVCRLPRIFRMIEARNVGQFEFDSYTRALEIRDQE